MEYYLLVSFRNGKHLKATVPRSSYRRWKKDSFETQKNFFEPGIISVKTKSHGTLLLRCEDIIAVALDHSR